MEAARCLVQAGKALASTTRRGSREMAVKVNARRGLHFYLVFNLLLLLVLVLSAGSARAADVVGMRAGLRGASTVEPLAHERPAVYGTMQQDLIHSQEVSAAEELPKEYTQMANLCEKMGDAMAAKQYRTAAQALAAPAPQGDSLQVKLQKAHAKARASEKKLDAAVLKFENMAQQLEAQRAHVSSLRSELAESEAEHGELVRQLHSQLPAKEVPVDKPALSIDDILDAERLSKMLDLSANGVFRIDELEYELTPEDTQELESRAAQLREGIQTLAASLFKDSKTKVDALRAEHDAHIKRLAAKRRRGE
ncbi:unnamed protein product, partial [Prorocentrum cordatum]